MPSSHPHDRVFKTSWFTKVAGKAGIEDSELCTAVRQARDGKCDDLGSGVYKKRVGLNLYRSIILAKGRRYWVLTYLFAKKDRQNITDAELKSFRDLAKAYEQMTADRVAVLLSDRELVEICRGDED
jgi:hypothetical protein